MPITKTLEHRDNPKMNSITFVLDVPNRIDIVDIVNITRDERASESDPTWLLWSFSIETDKLEDALSDIDAEHPKYENLGHAEFGSGDLIRFLDNKLWASNIEDIDAIEAKAVEFFK